ncbi:hypothetical protein [Corynebacterium sp. CCM 9203]|uniref:hypothetical protein n=1 Tax=Corynebacterium sp. CCM 9203 TaxID=3057615 RepID=UPI003526642B
MNQPADGNLHDEISREIRQISYVIDRFIRTYANRQQRQQWRAYTATHMMKAPKAQRSNAPAVRARATANIAVQWGTAHARREHNPQAAQQWDKRLDAVGVDPRWVKQQLQTELAQSKARVTDLERQVQQRSGVDVVTPVSSTAMGFAAGVVAGAVSNDLGNTEQLPTGEELDAAVDTAIIEAADTASTPTVPLVFDAEYFTTAQNNPAPSVESSPHVVSMTSGSAPTIGL